MTDSSRRESNSHRDSNRRNDGFKKRNDRNNSSSDRNRNGKKFGDKKFGDRRFSDRRDSRGEGKNFGERRRPNENGERHYGERDNNRRHDRNQRGERRYDGNRQERRGGGRRYNNENRPSGGHQRGGQQRREAREYAASSARGETQGYRPSKGVAPELDTDVTGKELDFGAQRELRALEKDNAEAVAKHLVMAGRYLEIDPAFALEHAKYATKRAGRISAVREAAGIAAYVAEDFELSLRELRTHRRISGSNEHLALLIDNERALGRIEKALELAEESKTLDLKPAERVEIALVVSGIKYDGGDLQAAIKTLEIPELNSKRGFEYSPRLFSAYAALLEEDGRGKEAARWDRLATMTEAALGQGAFAEPEIFDIFGEADLFEPEEPSVDLENAEENASADQESAEELSEEPNETSAESTISEEQAAEENLRAVEEKTEEETNENE